MQFFFRPHFSVRIVHHSLFLLSGLLFTWSVEGISLTSMQMARWTTWSSPLQFILYARSCRVWTFRKCCRPAWKLTQENLDQWRYKKLSTNVYVCMLSAYDESVQVVQCSCTINVMMHSPAYNTTSICQTRWTHAYRHKYNIDIHSTCSTRAVYLD